MPKLLQTNAFWSLLLAVFLVCGDLALAAGPIYISQVQITGGKNNTGNDFIEFFNASSSPINLKGYRLVKRPGEANSDTLVKSWSKDTFIPAKSFYLWANSGFVSLSVKPDAVSSATISDNSGIALRLGSVNSGEIVDAVSWGKTGNGFKNVSAVNPKANQALTRKDLYQVSSAYVIAAASPHNSLTNDLAAAFEASRETNQAPQKIDNPSTLSTNAQGRIESSRSATSSGTVGNNNQAAAKQPQSVKAAVATVDSAPVAAAQTNAGQVEGVAIVDNADVSANTQSPEPAKPVQNNPSQSSKKGAVKYLILSGTALLLLLVIAKKFLFSKGK
jgi:hypothetical protein